MYPDTYEEFLRNDEAHARVREIRVKRSLVLDYEDGGELKCGICGRICFHHFWDGHRNDIGECCNQEAA